MAERPKVAGETLKEVEKLDAQFKRFDEQAKSLTLDQMNKAPLQDIEQQTLMSIRQQNRMDAPYIKPERTIGCRAAFNEKFRKQWEHQKQYVRCMVENLEIIGENVECWSKPFAGVP